MGVNLSDDPYHEDEYENLVRVLHKEPVQPPPLGSKPDFSKKPSSTSQAGDFIAAEAKDGSARFRAPDEPLGLFWMIMPLVQRADYEVFLAKGPAIWLRIIPRHAIPQEWSHEALLKCGGDQASHYNHCCGKICSTYGQKMASAHTPQLII